MDKDIIACPVCGHSYSSRHCPWCGWEIESTYILGPLTPEDIQIYRQKLEDARHRWKTSRMNITAINTRYDKDLYALDGVWDITKVINKETVFIITGCRLMPELLDKPVAGLLRDEIERRGHGRQYRRGIILVDAVWRQETILHSYPVISIGGPLVNAVTEEITLRGKRLILNGYDCGSWVDGLPQVALWGEKAIDTLAAVECFIQHPDGLDRFLKLIWKEVTL